MLTEDEKLDRFIAAVGRLYPKAVVTDPMNTRHADMKVMWDEAIDMTMEHIIKGRPPTSKELLGEARVALNSRITNYLTDNKKLFVYVAINDPSEMKFRSKITSQLENNIYYKFIGQFSSAKVAKDVLKDRA